VSIGGDWYDKERSIAFLPEPCGAVHIFVGEGPDGEKQCIDLPDALRAQLNGTIWEDSHIEVRSETGIWYFQPCIISFLSSGSLDSEPILVDTARTFEFAAQVASALNTPSLNGTSVTVGLETEDGPLGPVETIRATLATTNKRKTPFLYAVSGFLEAANRDGSKEQIWASDDNDDGDPIEDVEVQFEGEMRRAQYVITMRDVSGKTLGDGLGARYPALEDRTGTLSIGGVPVVTHGIFKTATLSAMGGAIENQVRSAVTTPATEVQNLLCDTWAILDETILEEAAIIGDGLTVGTLLRRALQFAGETETRLAGIDPDAGKLIKFTEPGEGWRCANSGEVSLGEFIRDIVQKHGRGWRLYQTGGGIWTFAPPPTTVALVNGHAAHFTSDPALNHPDTYPGRFAMLKPVGQVRDSSELYNFIRVAGGEGKDGLRVSFTWPIPGSIQRGLGLPARNYIGRKKTLIINDSGAKTRNECEDIARSAALHVARPGRLHSFTTYFHRGLFPGDLITVDGILCIIRKIGSGSTKNDTMQIDAQEL
jgi:hypothetical protein